MSVIEIRSLTRDYGGGRGVFDLSFCVEEGEIFGFLGPNGAGKTTTIRHLMGFLKSQGGSCNIGGLDCWQDRVKIQKTLGYLPGEIAFFDGLTGAEFLRFISNYRGANSDGRLKELLERFEIDPNSKLKKMSKGMKQKIGIVAAFMHDPAVLILDEPTSGLDPLMQNRFVELVFEEKKKGKTILMSSHMFGEVERTCHRVGIIKNGRLAAVDSVDALKAAQSKKYIVTLDTAQSAEKFAQIWKGEAEISQASVTITVKNNLNDLILLMQKHPVVDLSAPTQSLEEVFMQYYGGAVNV